jgi:hypothetical protein
VARRIVIFNPRHNRAKKGVYKTPLEFIRFELREIKVYICEVNIDFRFGGKPIRLTCDHIHAVEIISVLVGDFFTQSNEKMVAYSKERSVGETIKGVVGFCCLCVFGTCVVDIHFFYLLFIFF